MIEIEDDESGSLGRKHNVPRTNQGLQVGPDANHAEIASVEAWLTYYSNEVKSAGPLGNRNTLNSQKGTEAVSRPRNIRAI